MLKTLSAAVITITSSQVLIELLYRQRGRTSILIGLKKLTYVFNKKFKSSSRLCARKLSNCLNSIQYINEKWKHLFALGHCWMRRGSLIFLAVVCELRPWIWKLINSSIYVYFITAMGAIIWLKSVIFLPKTNYNTVLLFSHKRGKFSSRFNLNSSWWVMQSLAIWAYLSQNAFQKFKIHSH
jgi:hypothetical protein